MEKAEFRQAMAHLPAAVNVLTTDGVAGRAGLTATAVCSVTDEPGTLLVCINRTGRAHEAFLANGVFAVNTLASGQQAVGDRFAREKELEARFDGASWDRLVTGAPALEGAAIVFDCKISAVSEVGTHSVIFGHVQAVRMAEHPSGLLYFGRGYHKIGLE